MSRLSYYEFTEHDHHGRVVVANTSASDLQAPPDAPRLRLYVDDEADEPTPCAFGVLQGALKRLVTHQPQFLIEIAHEPRRAVVEHFHTRYFGLETKRNRLHEIAAAEVLDTMRAQAAFRPFEFVVIEIGASGPALTRLMSMAASAAGQGTAPVVVGVATSEASAPVAEVATTAQTISTNADDPDRALMALRDELLAQGWPTSEDVGSAAGSQAGSNPSNYASQLRKKGRLLGVWSTPDRTYRHPGFQFDALGRVREEVSELLALLPKETDRNGWRRVFWLYADHPRLDDRRPAEVFKEDPQRVIALAGEQFHGDPNASW